MPQGWEPPPVKIRCCQRILPPQVHAAFAAGLRIVLLEDSSSHEGYDCASPMLKAHD
jgi:hypothetical protein